MATSSIGIVHMTRESTSGPEQVGGVVPVQTCPYTEDGDVDVDGLKENTRFLAEFAEEGDRDVMVITNGSTAECYANSIAEQKRVIDATVAASGDLPVIAGTSRAGTKETIGLTEYAAAAGADLAMVVVPYYHIPTEDGLVEHYRRIAEAVDIGIVLYNNPDVSKAWIGSSLFERLAGIENVVAIKDNVDVIGHSYDMGRAAERADVALLSGLGHANYAAKASLSGRYTGFVSTVANFAPSLAYDLYEAVEAGDRSRATDALHRQAIFGDVLADLMDSRRTTSLQVPGWEGNYMYISAVKAAMDEVGLNGGRVRLPMVDVTEEERAHVRDGLERMGLL